jgi:hypothetical protein
MWPETQAIRKWKPWEKSTGPNTEEGKAKSSQNALKHGMRSSKNRAVEAIMAFYGRAERAARLKIKNR